MRLGSVLEVQSYQSICKCRITKKFRERFVTTTTKTTIIITTIIISIIIANFG